MTDEERRIITEYVQRVAGAAPQARPSSPWGNTGTGQQAQAASNLPPVDPEADRLISDLFARHPEARYRLTQTAFVQEAALVQAQNRIQELEWENEAARRQAEAAPQRGGMFGGLFGGGNRPAPMPPRPQPMQPPGNYDPRMLQQQGRGGMGFMGTALTTAAGVAGGMVLGNALMGMFSGGAAEAATTAATDAAGAAGDFGQEAVATPASSPWTDPTGGAGEDASPVQDNGGWGDDAQDGGFADDADAGGFDDEF